MKEAKKKIQKDFGVTAGLLVLSILYTVAIMFIDVRPIGPQGSVVGFATVNQYFHTLFGTNMLLYNITDLLSIPILETKNPVFSMLSSVKCRNSQEINDFSTLSDTLFYPLSQNQKYLQSGFHPNPEGYRKSTVRLDNC